MKDCHIIVVKLGGSLADSRYLADWIDTLASCGGRCVVVPGGGPFADTVRQAQEKIRFSDAAAHHLALLAMEQFGWALASLNLNFCVADSAISIESALRAGNVPVWSPAKMVLSCREIPSSWDVTSDSLAAWLAGQLGARPLVLVKRIAPLNGPLSAVDLAARGIVDQAFPHFLAASRVPASIVAAEAFGSAQKAINERGTPGTPIDLHDLAAKRLLEPLWPRSNSRVGDGH